MKKLLVLFLILKISGSNLFILAQDEIPLNKVFCYRQIEKQGNVLTVTLLINTVGLEREKTLKIKEKFPNGFQCKVLEPYGSTNAVTETSVLFVWSALPANELFITKYQLTSPVSLNELVNIIGNVSFLSETGIKYVSVEQRDFMSNKEIAAKIKNMPPYKPGANVSQPISSNIVVADVPKTTEVKPVTQEAPPPKPIVRTNVKDEPQKITSQEPIATQTIKVESKVETKTDNVERVVLTEDNPIATPQPVKTEQKVKPTETKPIETKTPVTQSSAVSKTGLYYTVQIGASAKPLPKGYYDKYQFNQPVDELFIDNMYKYSVGRFSTLKEANNYQNYVKQKGLQCFVVAYNGGQKITIKEALSISKE
jgi:hypothetical protein